MEKVARALFEDDNERERFLAALARAASGATAVAWLRSDPPTGMSPQDERPGWLPTWVSVAAEGDRPGKSPAHDAGEIYCLDLSSTFACAALSGMQNRAAVIVDVCASPGGKGIMARRCLTPDLLVGNEVIGKRTAQLIANYKRCGIDPSVVTSLDPEVLGREIPKAADLVIVDAPCSGQSLVLKGMAAPGAFHPATIGMNERRQRRILAHSQNVVAPGGSLLYSTCTFSREENEQNVEWFLRTFPHFKAVDVPSLKGYQSHLSEEPCYRLWPQAGEGAGAFCALFEREEESSLVNRSADSVLAQIRTAWRSPTLFVYRGEVSKEERSRANRSDSSHRKKPYKRERYRHQRD